MCMKLLTSVEESVCNYLFRFSHLTIIEDFFGCFTDQRFTEVPTGGCMVSTSAAVIVYTRLMQSADAADVLNVGVL